MPHAVPASLTRRYRQSSSVDAGNRYQNPSETATASQTASARAVYSRSFSAISAASVSAYVDHGALQRPPGQRGGSGRVRENKTAAARGAALRQLDHRAAGVRDLLRGRSGLPEAVLKDLGAIRRILRQRIGARERSEGFGVGVDQRKKLLPRLLRASAKLGKLRLMGDALLLADAQRNDHRSQPGCQGAAKRRGASTARRRERRGEIGQKNIQRLFFCLHKLHAPFSTSQADSARFRPDRSSRRRRPSHPLRHAQWR